MISIQTMTLSEMVSEGYRAFEDYQRTKTNNFKQTSHICTWGRQLIILCPMRQGL